MSEAGRVGVVIAAAGQGTRLGAGMPKALAALGGMTLISHAVRGVRAALPEAPVVVVEPSGDSRLREAVERELGSVPGLAWASGGAERSDSVRAGLEPIIALGCEWVLIHDCARALTPAAVFRRVLEGLRTGASGVIPAVPVVDTVKLVSADGSQIESTPARSRLRAVQTPQGFRTEDLWLAHTKGSAGVDAAAATDDAMLLEALGRPVRVVEGDPRALKVTTPIDLILAEHYLASPDQSHTAPTEESR